MQLVRSRSSVFALIAGIALASPAALLAQKQLKRVDAVSYPAHILIIRHAEKPPTSSRSVDLAPEGVARAKRLHELFEASPTRPKPLPRPDFIFATADTKQSHRPSETAAALGASLHLDVDTRFGDKHVKGLAREILTVPKYAGKTVLIVWHQGTIPDLAKALGADDAPDSWKDSVFDRVWEITYNRNGEAFFESHKQHLASGDAK
jgi:broad specificity phosphatase PhoE